VASDKSKNKIDLTRADSRTSLQRKKNVTATSMEEIRWDPDGIYKENPYYIRLANRYRFIKYAVVLLLLGFVVVMMTAFTDDITTENFQYLIKDLDLSGLATGDVIDTILYNGGNDSSFGVYRGELAVVGPGTVSLYKPSSALSFNQTNIFYSPQLLTSEKYFLVYDRGETSRSYSVYNSFAELKTETLDYPITGAALADNGNYAIVTRDDSYRGIVRMYDSNFRLIMEIEKDKYIVSIDLSEDGKTLAILAVYDQKGDYVAELTTVKVGAVQPDVTVTEIGSMPLSARFMKDGHIGVLYTDCAVIYHNNGTRRATYPYASAPSVSAVLGRSYVCTVYNTSVIGNDKTVEVFDTDGQKLISCHMNGELLDLVSGDESICLLFEDSAVRLDPKLGQVRRIALEANALDIVFSNNTPIVCYSGSASSLDFEENGTVIGS